jgi:hypothetical protein
VKEKGRPLKPEDVDEGESLGETSEEVESDNESEYAAKYFRFFSRTEENLFGLFIEHGLNRNHEVKLMKDHQSLQLTLEIPVPPDDLLKAAKFHATMAQLQPVKEEFMIEAPKKLNPNTKAKACFPTARTPIWTVYTYSFEEEAKDEEPDRIQIDLTSMLTQEQPKKI